MTREYTYRWTQREGSVSPTPDRVHTTQRHALAIEDADMLIDECESFRD